MVIQRPGPKKNPQVLGVLSVDLVGRKSRKKLLVHGYSCWLKKHYKLYSYNSYSLVIVIMSYNSYKLFLLVTTSNNYFFAPGSQHMLDTGCD